VAGGSDGSKAARSSVRIAWWAPPRDMSELGGDEPHFDVAAPALPAATAAAHDAKTSANTKRLIVPPFLGGTTTSLFPVQRPRQGPNW
jgi:hypothetical protein